jgi:hypothetical protein
MAARPIATASHPVDFIRSMSATGAVSQQLDFHHGLDLRDGIPVGLTAAPCLCPP